MVEAISLDEAYLDVSASNSSQGSATLMAREIKRLIFERTGLTSSAGVSYNKFLAKIASDRQKPDGLCIILPNEAMAIIEAMPIGTFHGIGPATEQKMQRLGIWNGADLGRKSQDFLTEHFGKAGRHYYLISRGIDERPVNPNRIRKSWGAEITFQSDLNGKGEMLQHLEDLAGKILLKMSARKMGASTVTLKVKYADFEMITRSLTLNHKILEITDVQPYFPELLDKTEAGSREVRLLGVSFSNLDGVGRLPVRQLDIFRNEG